MFERLYYNDSYLSQFQANVIACEGERAYLDRTAFYPTAGGQPHDVGTLAGQLVVDVVDEGDRIAHVLSHPVQIGAATGLVDWTRRYDHMQQHTGQHLLSAIASELFGFQTLSFHMGPAVSTIELGCKELSPGHIHQLEQRTNGIVHEARPVVISYEDAEAAEGLRKASQRSGELRIVSISGLDRSACGGTHVRSTAELGPILIRRQEKIRGNVRIEFVCGDRALQRVRKDFLLLSDLSRQTAAAIDDLPEHVNALRSKLTQADKQGQALASELAHLTGVELYRNTPISPDGVRRVLLRVPAIDNGTRAKLQAFVGQGSAVGIAVGEQGAGVLLACSPGVGLDAAAALKSVLPRAGGSGTIAQGSLPDQSYLAKLLAVIGLG